MKIRKIKGRGYGQFDITSDSGSEKVLCIANILGRKIVHVSWVTLKVRGQTARLLSGGKTEIGGRLAIANGSEIVKTGPKLRVNIGLLLVHDNG